MRLLLERGANLELVTEYGEPALLVAIACGHVDAARLLLERGADVTRAATSGPGHGMDALAVAKHHNRGAVVALLEEHYTAKFPLYAAARTGDVEAMTQLLDGGAEVDSDCRAPVDVPQRHLTVGVHHGGPQRARGATGARSHERTAHGAHGRERVWRASVATQPSER